MWVGEGGWHMGTPAMPLALPRSHLRSSVDEREQTLIGICESAPVSGGAASEC